MKINSYLILISSLLVTQALAAGPPAAAAAAPAAGGAPAPGGGAAAASSGNNTDMLPIIRRGWNNPRTVANYSELLKDDIITEEPQVEEAIKTMEHAHCDLMFVHCVDNLMNIHKHIKPEKVEGKCLKKIKRLILCLEYVAEDATKARANMEALLPTSAPVGAAVPPT